jgi:Microtubule-associated protein 70
MQHTYVIFLFIFAMQGEMQQLRDKLAIAERTARSEAQLKVRLAFHILLCPYKICSLLATELTSF